MENRPGESGDDATGLPVLRSWRAVYIFVLVFFGVVVALLFALSRMYS